MAQEEDNGAESKQFSTFIAKNDYTVCMIQGQAKVSELEKMRSKLLRALNKLKKEAGQEAVNSTSPLRMTRSTPLTHHQLAASHPAATTPSVAPTIQLPKMSMRTYNGDYRDWMPFKNWFTITIMSQPLSPLQMFMYLHSCLEKGSTAEQAIAAISITEENFKLAWDTLEKVCGDQKKIIRNHWRTLQKHSITTLHNASNSELRKQLDSLKLAVSQLKQAGEGIESRSVQILIEQNWPPKVMERLIDKEATTSTEMLQALEDILKRQEEIQSLCYGEERKPNPTTKNSSQPKLNEHISSAMFVSSSKKKNDKKLGKNKKEARGPYCILHEIEGHWSNECKAYPDDEAKKRKLKEEKRCTICTSKKHTQCERKVSCALCKGDHHHIFHKESKKPSKKPMSLNSTAVEETHAGCFSVNSAFDIKGNKQKMLYLVEVNVFNPLNPSKQVKTLAILDNGAEQSFVHADITNKLNIKGQKKKLYLSTFGSKDVSVDSFIVNLGFQIFDGSNIQMEVRSIDFMMRPIRTVLATSNVDMEANCLEPKLYQPQILIGIDQINEILLSFRQRLPSRFWKQSTLFGPVIGGKGFTVKGMNEAEFSENSNTMSMFMLAEPHHEKDLQVEAQLENLVKTQYEIDKIGISDSPEKSADDVEATKILHEHMRIDENGRIEVPLLWKKGTLKVPKNRALAYGRFVSEVKKLSKNPNHLREYDRIIREYNMLPFHHPTAERRRRNWPIQIPIWRLSAMVIQAYIFAVAYARDPCECAETFTIIASENTCQRTAYGVKCKISQSTLVMLHPNAQTTCLMLRDPQGHPFGVLKIRFETIDFTCKYIEHHFTRQVELMDISTKLCPREGSCRDDWCGKIKPQQIAEEFNGTPNKRPGYTYCAEGCSFLACGCPLPSAACIPWRVYAMETIDSTIYTIKSCHWEEKIPIEAKLWSNVDFMSKEVLHNGSTMTTFNFDLHPGFPTERNGLKMILVSQIIPPTQLLNSYFISNQTHVSLLDEKGFKDSKLFICTSPEKARMMECVFPPEASSCRPAEGRANCAHRQVDLKKIMEEHTLPYTSPQLVFYASGLVPTAEFTQQTSLAALVHLEDFELETIIDLVEIDFTIHKFHGCARCSTGSEMEFTCLSNVKSAEAHVECESIHFAISCFDLPRVQTIHLAVEKIRVNESCLVLFPGGSKQIQVEAEFYIAEAQHLHEETDGSHALVRRFGRNYRWLYDWIWCKWWMPFLVGGSGLIALLVIVIATCPACIVVFCCALRRRRPHQD